MDFFGELESRARAADSLVCVGLDPRVPRGPDAARAVAETNRRVIEACAPYAACFKPNSAFYEVHGPEGMAALAETIAMVPPDIPVLLDAKRGDIDSTAAAYAEAAFSRLGAGAVTVAPYLGRDSVDPFLAFEGRAVFVLARTSNPRAGVFQDLPVASMPRAHGSDPSGALAVGAPGAEAEPLYLRVAREAVSWSERVGLVVAGNDPKALRAARSVAPLAWFLAPGIGAQGGDAGEAFRAGSRADGLGLLAAASRSVAEAADPGAAARALRDAIRAARDGAVRLHPGFGPGKTGGAAGGAEAAPESGGGRGGRPGDAGAELTRRVMDGLVRAGCFKIGSFRLKSGAISPYYIDLRRVVSDPALFADVSKAYASLAREATWDRVAGIPAAALPLAAGACLELSAPMVWPRMPAKDHGTGVRVEGEFRAGERVLLLDDLVTTGMSKLEAAEILRSEGLVVQDLAVLLERGVSGRKELEGAGLRVRAFLSVGELLARCEELGMIDGAARASMEAWSGA
ncbi:MAG: orotidine-5'-phosphate decarboxylase [Spirochaetales bacterium]|nr:orotidine-5'-phosphate decarboxylase [Spirochaetales bacterium]